LIYPDRALIVAIPELKRYVAEGRAVASRLPVVRSDAAEPGKGKVEAVDADRAV
jgi:hypothetical protein